MKTSAPRRTYKRSQRGASLIEFVLVANLLFLILFGIVEMGLLFKDNTTIAQAAREAARAASLGSQTSVVQSRAISTATTITLTASNITLEKSADGVTWTALGNSGVVNDAVTGYMVRATILYNHPLITSLVFKSGTKQLKAVVVMRRE